MLSSAYNSSALNTWPEVGTPHEVGRPSMPDFNRNSLLGAISPMEWARWAPYIEPFQMPLGQVLYESGDTLRYVYFPTTAIVALLYVMECGASAEIAIVGNEGIVGISLFMGGNSTPNRAVVQSAGWGYRLPAHIMKEEFERGGDVQHLLLRYTQALFTQTAQTAACNRHHAVDQQLSRFLLLSMDRLEGDVLVMTQELIANMLGVRREGITEAALKLQHAGLIKYTRGKITILDRSGLEKRSCECYSVVKKEYDRLLPRRCCH
jgi:CRP-like cAMP-binding protein